MDATTENPSAIEDYALIGDCASAALISRTGSLDWLCLPRFDSPACFAALLGTPEHGRWLIAPADAVQRSERRYRDGSMVLETDFETAEGAVRLIDFMPPGQEYPVVVRIVRGLRGRVTMRAHLTMRFDYGVSIPWVTRLPEGAGISAIAGPHRVLLRSRIPLHRDGELLASLATFDVAEGESEAFVLSYAPSHLPDPPLCEATAALETTQAFWSDWGARFRYEGRHRAAVYRSLLTLKALTFAATGGVVDAPTTSLPEQLGGPRNWDYRFCWLRDASLTLTALMTAGYYDEAQTWCDWLHRAVAGSPQQIQIMYGVAGERQLMEWEASWLPGYQGASPVRIGNAAAGQLQLDVYGEVMDAMHHARAGGLKLPNSSWSMQTAMLEHLATIWEEPDEGLWEVRGGRRHFTFSKVMAWVAFDRSIRDAERYDLPAPLERWREIRGRIHAVVCEQGYDAEKGSFVQSFGNAHLDASLLLIPLVGFLPPTDERVRGTLAATERELVEEGFVLRYRTESGADGLPPGEGVFLACSFWLVDNLRLQGRQAEADALFERLLSLRNDVGLLSEEYDVAAKRLVGNMPQAFSHLALVDSALLTEQDL
jgi:GH15 family glucan-1,4-alpha-glucosidase